MGFGKKLGRWVLDAAVVAGAATLVWKLQKPSPPVAPTVEAGGGPRPPGRAGGVWPRGASWGWWRDVLLDTYEAMGTDRLLAVAAGVVFYALLAMVPAITAFVSLYGLFARPGTIEGHLSLLADLIPASGIDLLREQIVRIASRPGGLGVGFAVGLLIALWSANAGIKAMIDALNVIEGRNESRGFIRLNLISLSMTLGAIAFLLLSVGAVVVFPLVMSTFGLNPFTGTATWLVRWPILFLITVGALAVFYRVAPSGPRTHRTWLTPGAVTGALVWLAGSAALSFYLSNFADYNATYGSLGAAIGLMTWMWLSAIAVLIGAELDTVIACKAASSAGPPSQ